MMKLKSIRCILNQLFCKGKSMPLKILVVIEKNSWVDLHIANSLELMGHSVTRFYFGEYISEFYGVKRHAEQKEKNIALVSTIKTLRDHDGLDLIFCYVYDDFLLPKYAKELSNLNIPMVNYNVDMPSQWYRQIRTAQYFNLMLCAQPDYMENLARYSKKVFYFPMAAQTLFAKNSEALEKKMYEVTFLGTALPSRRLLIAALSDTTTQLSIFGKYWNSSESARNIIRSKEKTLSDIVHYAYPRLCAEGLNKVFQSLLNRFYSNDKENIPVAIPASIIKGKFLNNVSVLFKESKINLGLTRYAIDDPNQIGHCQMKLRDFEVPMAGGFYLCEKSPGYDQEFTDGKEVVMWRTYPELVEKIHYYLRHEDERETIARAGHRRALQDHTWEVRFNKLFFELGLSTN